MSFHFRMCIYLTKRFTMLRSLIRKTHELTALQPEFYQQFKKYIGESLRYKYKLSLSQYKCGNEFEFVIWDEFASHWFFVLCCIRICFSKRVHWLSFICRHAVCLFWLYEWYFVYKQHQLAISISAFWILVIEGISAVVAYIRPSGNLSVKLKPSLSCLSIVRNLILYLFMAVANFSEKLCVC